MYAHVNARFFSLNAALPKASSNSNGIVFLTSVADINLAVKSAGRQTGLWSISTVRGWSILADHFQSHGLNSLSLSLSLSLVTHFSILSQQHRRKTVKQYKQCPGSALVPAVAKLRSRPEPEVSPLGGLNLLRRPRLVVLPRFRLVRLLHLRQRRRQLLLLRHRSALERLLHLRQRRQQLLLPRHRSALERSQHRRRRRLPLEVVSLVLRQLLQQQLEVVAFSAQHRPQQHQQHRPQQHQQHRPQQQQQLGEAVFSVRHLQPRQLRPHLPRHPLALVRLNLRRQRQPLEEVDSLVRPNQRRQQQKRPNLLQQVVVFLGLQQRRHLLQLLQRRQRQQRQQRQKQHLPPWRLRR